MNRRTLLTGMGAFCICVRSGLAMTQRVAEAQDIEGNTFSLNVINGANHLAITTKAGNVVVAELGIRMFKAFKNRFKDAKKKAMALEDKQIDSSPGISNVSFTAMGMGAMGCVVVVKMQDGSDKAQFTVALKGKRTEKNDRFTYYNVNQFEAVLDRLK